MARKVGADRQGRLVCAGKPVRDDSSPTTSCCSPRTGISTPAYPRRGRSQGVVRRAPAVARAFRAGGRPGRAAGHGRTLLRRASALSRGEPRCSSATVHNPEGRFALPVNPIAATTSRTSAAEGMGRRQGAGVRVLGNNGRCLERQKVHRGRPAAGRSSARAGQSAEGPRKGGLRGASSCRIHEDAFEEALSQRQDDGQAGGEAGRQRGVPLRERRARADTGWWSRVRRFRRRARK